MKKNTQILFEWKKTKKKHEENNQPIISGIIFILFHRQYEETVRP